MTTDTEQATIEAYRAVADAIAAVRTAAVVATKMGEYGKGSVELTALAAAHALLEQALDTNPHA
jgi:hypothetical protein